MSQDPIDLNAYRQRRQRSQSKGKEKSAPTLLKGEVACPRCRQAIAGCAKQCIHCGIHFTGEAADFTSGAARPPWVKTVLCLLVLCLLISLWWW